MKARPSKRLIFKEKVLSKFTQRGSRRMQKLKDYQYDSLKEPDSAGFEIRLVTLLKSSPGHPIQIALSTQQMPSEGTCDVEYEALSYAWGDFELAENIIVQDSSNEESKLGITKNLFSALKHLRYDDRDRVLWIDAICINQKSSTTTQDEEKIWCIRTMDKIFSRSKRVVMWLGDAEDGSDLIVRDLDRLGSYVAWDGRSGELTLSDEIEASQVYQGVDQDNLGSFVARPWFDRLWIRQEVFLAPQDSFLQCGNFSIGVPNFRQAIHYLAKNSYQGGPVTGFRFRLGRISHLFDNTFESITSIMMIIRGSACSIPADAVYGAIGMMTATTRHRGLVEGIQIDYSIPTGDVFRDLFLRHMRSRRSLRLIEDAGLVQESDITPSWVPDWSIRYPGSISMESQLAASLAYYTDAEYLGNNILRVNGVVACKVDQVLTLKVPAGEDGSDGQVRALHDFMHTHLSTGDSDLRIRRFAKIMSVFLPRTYVPYPEHNQVMHNIIQLVKSIYDEYPLKESVETEMQESLIILRQLLQVVETDGTLLVFSGDYVGAGVGSTQVGDLICAVIGCRHLLILRPTTDDKYNFVESCFMHGLNWGEAFLGPLPAGVEVQSLLSANTGYDEPYFVDTNTGVKDDWDPRISWDDLDPDDGSWPENPGRTLNKNYFVRRGAKVVAFDLI